MAVSHAHPKSNLAIAQERSAKVSYAKQHPQSMFQHFSNSIINKQATSKIWPLHPFEGFFYTPQLELKNHAWFFSQMTGDFFDTN